MKVVMSQSHDKTEYMVHWPNGTVEWLGFWAAAWLGIWLTCKGHKVEVK